MKEICRICARELCGNQRRWIFHPASKLNLQVLLSYVLGKDVTRDGKAEFACSKCAFMLDRVYRFDTVIARIEALSLERLQKLLLEKDRLKFCIASMYRKNNDDSSEEIKAGSGTVDISSLPDMRYSALLQEDFAYSGFECWVENEEQSQESHSCHGSEGPGNRPRRCRGCAALRVADSDYEAICKVPRKVARSISYAPSSRCSTSICTEEPALSEVGPPDLASTKVPPDGESMEEGTPGSSVESLDASVQASPPQQKDEEMERSAKELLKCDYCSDEQAPQQFCNHKLELALSMIKGLEYKPLQSPRGSKLPIPVKSSPLGAKPGHIMTNGVSSSFLNRPLTPVSYPLELSDLQELWDDLYEEYLPLQFQPQPVKLLKQQKLDSDETPVSQPIMDKSVSDSHLEELQDKIQQTEASNKILQEKLNEMSCELRAAQESSQKQDVTIQSLKELLKSRESETEELYQVIEGQNETMAKLREMLRQSQLGQLHSSEGIAPTQQQVTLLDLQNALFCSQLEIQKLQRLVRQKERRLADVKRCMQFVEATAQETEQQKEASWKHNQELQELLQYRDNPDKTLETNEVLVEKMQQQIQDRAVDLERAIDEKFSALEEKDKELQQLHRAVRERDHDLERLRSVLSANETTMQDLRATFLSKLGPGQSEVAEELCQRLKQKEGMLQDLLSDLNKQTVEHEMEIQGLLQSMSTREQANQAAAEKMVQAFLERNTELHALRQYLGERDLIDSRALLLNQQVKVTSIGPHLGEQTDQSSVQVPSRDGNTSLTAREDASMPRSTLGDSDTVAGLEKELSNAKEELELMAKKERESQIELSALQSMMAVQEDELQVQAADLESLTRNIQIKEDLIKDLQMQLVDPEDIPAMERLTQEVLLLREKVASVESQGQEVSGNRRQQLLLMLEGLVDERSRLNEALQAERQLYSSLVKFHAHPENSERDRTLQVELEGAQALRGRLEEVLGRSLERLSRLETMAAIGGTAAGDDTEDASTEFTDSIEEEAAHNSHQQLIKVALEKSLATMETQKISLQPPSSAGGDSNRCLQEELLHLRAEVHQHLEEKRKAEAELKELKAQIEEAGFSSVSHIRNTMLSLCLENAELKEQMGEAMSDGWEVEEDKEKGEVMVETVADKGGVDESSLQAEFRKVQGKLKSAHNIINILKEQLVLSNSEGSSKVMPELLVRLAREVDRMNTGLPSPGKNRHQEQENVTTRPGPRPQSLNLGAALSVDTHQLENKPQAQDSGHQPEFSLSGSTKHLRSQLAQCRQRYQDLQEKLLISEATVFAQANQLEKYRAIFSESLVKQDSKQIQVDLQDLGYETCGRSENEADRDETTSPECEEHNSPRPVMLLEGLCSDQGYLDPVLDSPPAKKPFGNNLGRQEEFQVHGSSDDSSILRKDIRDLKAQLQNANKVIQNLRSRVRSLSATSDYSSSLERPRKLRTIATLEGSSPHSVTDEDEGWLSDGTGAFYPPGLQAKKDLESLIQRVSQLEAQLPKTGLEGKLSEELRSASWPGKYDSLIQDQARELSYLRQKIREGRGICYLLTQHAKDTVKSFEDLLRSNDIDYYLGQSFREQLTQGGQLIERLTCKLSTKDHKSEKEEAGLEPLALRLSRELQEKEKVIEVLQAKLDTRSLSPPSSHALSDSHRSASSTSFLSDEIEACSDMDVASEYTLYDEKKPSPGHSATSASQGLKVKSSNSPIILPTPQNTPKEARQAHSGVSTAPPASTAALLSSHAEVNSPRYLNPTQPHSPTRGIMELGRIPEPGYLGSSGHWDMMRPQKGSNSGDLSSGSSLYQLNSKPTGADLLEEHLSEIRSLRQRLEESICVNDRLREQLQHRLSSTGRESGHSQEMDRLQEALLSSQSQLQELEKELEQQKAERQQLLEDLKEKQEEILHFREERLSLQEKDSRLQHKLAFLQQQCEEKQQLSLSLQSELQIYESLCGNPKTGLKAFSLDSCHQVPSELSYLVAEIRALRGQLEQSIQGNNCLRRQLEQQLDCGAGKANLNPSSVGQNFSASVEPASTQPLFQELGSDDSTMMTNPPKLEGDATDGSFANKRGRHVIGHIDDYSALQQQIGEGKLLVQKILSLSRLACNIPGPEAQGTEVPGNKSIRELRSSTSALNHTLEESASLLTMFWRAALPSQHGPGLVGKAGQLIEKEILDLRAQVSQQEQLLQKTNERLKTAKQKKKNMEQYIVNHREILKGPATHLSLVTLAFQEPHKKRSQKPLKQQEGWACPSLVQLPIC
ncbi:myomegalin-like protein [Cricetulus griseus]|nr:myomegalin-like protein [Cricetulus griseus]